MPLWLQRDCPLRASIYTATQGTATQGRGKMQRVERENERAKVSKI
jgi:hypothetical protein